LFLELSQNGPLRFSLSFWADDAPRSPPPLVTPPVASHDMLQWRVLTKWGQVSVSDNCPDPVVFLVFRPSYLFRISSFMLHTRDSSSALRDSFFGFHSRITCPVACHDMLQWSISFKKGSVVDFCHILVCRTEVGPSGPRRPALRNFHRRGVNGES
jgi:hypothetical protein